MKATADTDDYGKQFLRELPVPLNEHELQLYGAQLATKVNEAGLLEERKKQINSEWSQKIKIVDNEVKRLADARAKGEEIRAVPCRERIRNSVIEIVRLDTMVVIDTRPAELRDLQPSLPGTGAPEIPADFDPGPRGDDLGTEHNGHDHKSSVGDTVHYMPDDEPTAKPPGGALCDGCNDEFENGDDFVLVGDGFMHKECADEYAADEGNVVRPDFGNPAHTQAQRDIEQREREIADDKAKAKPKRDRSKKSNASKPNGGKRKR